MILALVLFAVGLSLSAFFSGSETGFYRVARIRLRLDALSGDRIARGLWWIVNRPALFVATALVGNNLANYVTSLAIVIGVYALQPEEYAAALIAPFLFAPLIFVYGELLPKQLFYEAPYFLLRKGGALFLFFGVLFAPISLMLWGLSKLLERIAGRSHQQVQLTLARRELQSALEEGHAVGILRPAQRRLAQGLFAVANEPLSRFATPPHRLPQVQLGTSKREVLRLAQRQRTAELLVSEPGDGGKLIGYLRVAELKLQPSDVVHDVRPLIAIPLSQPHIVALVRLHEAGQSMARLVDEQGETVGVITDHKLSEPLFGGER